MRQLTLPLKRLSHCLIVSAGVRAGIRISTHLVCLIVSLSQQGSGLGSGSPPIWFVSLSHCLSKDPGWDPDLHPSGLSHCLIVSAGVRAGIRISTHLVCLIVSLSQQAFFPPGLERAPLWLLLPQHQIGHLDQQAALAAHQPDLLQLGAHLALPVGQIPHLREGLHRGVPEAHAVQSDLQLDDCVFRLRNQLEEQSAMLPKDVLCGMHQKATREKYSFWYVNTRVPKEDMFWVRFDRKFVVHGDDPGGGEAAGVEPALRQ